MPKDTNLKSLLIIGSGPIVIGQACEFDYSGSQALRSLKEDGIETILINSNPATIMTDPVMADHIYLLPLNTSSIVKILKEHPQIDAVLPTMGGQTALNLCIEADDKGIWDDFNVKIIGVDINAINITEDREQFRNLMLDIGIPMAPQATATSYLKGKEIAQKFGFPLVIRASFTLGGTGASFVYEEKDGWSWGQCNHDGYVGYIKSSNLFKTLDEPNHWVSAISSLVFPDSKGEYPPLMRLSMTAGVKVDSVEGDYARLASGGWIFKKHIKPIGEIQPDFLATASMLSREPYLWGGRGGQGIDCSGLIQVSLATAGLIVPRDTDQQANNIGIDVPLSKNKFNLQPSDIIFFPGHVGIYLGSGALLHASSKEMMVVTQSLEVVVARMKERHGRGITRVRRYAKIS